MVRRRRSIWDIFDEFFEDIFEDLDKEFRDWMKRFEEIEEEFAKAAREGRVIGPYVYGFSITIGPDGRPIIKEFGNIRREAGRPKIAEEREPLVDVLEDERTITVVAEVPGVNKEDIDIRIKDKTLIISAQSGDRKYYKEIELPAKVKPETAKASYKNGVLEVRLEKEKEKKKEEGIKIKVE